MTARILTLARTEPRPGDENGRVGVVAEAAVFSDGFTVLHWLPGPGGRAGRGGRARRGFEIYPAEADLRQARDSGRLELRDDVPRIPDGARYSLFVAMDPHGVSSPDGSGDRTREVASLDEAIAFLTRMAADGAEYVCLEILKYRPGDELARPVEEVPLPGVTPDEDDGAAESREGWTTAMEIIDGRSS